MEMRRETKEEEHTKEDNIHTIVFTAGSFLLMVCLKHFLVEQWRAWVFLILNVILLAILFMSLRPAKLDHSSETESRVEEVKSDNKEKKRPSGGSQETEEKDCYIKQSWSSTGTSSSNTYVHVENEVAEEDEQEEEEEEEQVPVLSKEELNERVEAFIAMFRQHLISDVKQAENFGHHKIEVSCC
ncbi:hypothetical protein PHAVU_004G023300 [Phaseolus vulgaris]|uniref:DUF4408 domain-containing protein n=1 Tax=Phaseolus vulgaris TaxID=3885 RepID=V7C1E0_PHAVU|nr:hypothetical protein PHAVU_004G023300g [Phaseolus vulgaris]ESW23158.1 hypothetical protein PHAVU_004G023300g [Phaseolus vulgaris]